MRRSSLPYIFAFGALILIKIILAYLGYRNKVRKYVRKFRKTLIKNGVPKKEAKKLANEIHFMKLKDLLGASRWDIRRK